MSAVGDILLAPDVRPFAVAAAIMVALGGIELLTTMVGLSISELVGKDFAVEAESHNALSGLFLWINAGRLPLLILIILILGIFSIGGFLLQGLAHAACNTTYNECCTVTAKILAWFLTCLQTGEDGNIPVALMYLLVPLTMGLSLFAVGSYDNRVYANIIIGGFGSSIMWFYLASNVITAIVFYLASDPGCVMMDTPLFWLFVLFGIIMTVYCIALVAEAVMERKVQDLGGEEE